MRNLNCSSELKFTSNNLICSRNEKILSKKKTIANHFQEKPSWNEECSQFIPRIKTESKKCEKKYLCHKESDQFYLSRIKDHEIRAIKRKHNTTMTDAITGHIHFTSLWIFILSDGQRRRRHYNRRRRPTSTPLTNIQLSGYSIALDWRWKGECIETAEPQRWKTKINDTNLVNCILIFV